MLFIPIRYQKIKAAFRISGQKPQTLMVFKVPFRCAQKVVELVETMTFRVICFYTATRNFIVNQKWDFCFIGGLAVI